MVGIAAVVVVVSSCTCGRNSSNAGSGSNSSRFFCFFSFSSNIIVMIIPSMIMMLMSSSTIGQALLIPLQGIEACSQGWLYLYQECTVRDDYTCIKSIPSLWRHMYLQHVFIMVTMKFEW